MNQTFLIKASVDVKKHLTVETDYKNLSVTFFFDNEKLTSGELFSLLIKKISSFKSVQIDFQTFLDCKFKNIEIESLSLILGTVVDHFLNFPISLKTKKDNKSKIEIINDSFFSNDAKVIVEAQNICKTLQEMPPNKMRPTDFVKKVKEIFSDSNVKISIIDQKGLLEKKLNLIYEVGQCSENDSYLIVLEIVNDSSAEKIALIGKGVCYDSGGLNIKTGNYMMGMKFDMSGAAVSLGTAYSLYKNKAAKNICILIPLVQNLVNEKAYKADDVIESHSGLTVEITNTDAEGRLILADAISYAENVMKASQIITIATLTGAVGYALGYKYAGAWSTDDKNWDHLHQSSKYAGENIWRLPLDDYYLSGLKSTIADTTNSAKTGAGGASRAAMFLKQFVNKASYIHLDIANIAHGENNEIATAPLLRTLYYYIKNY